MSEMYNRTKDWVETVYFNVEHALNTVEWVKKLKPGAREALLIAALTHDIERSFPQNRVPPVPEKQFSNPKLIKWRQERSAQMVKNFLRSEGAEQKLMDDVYKLVAEHETGGSRDADVLRDADSASFFEVNVSRYIASVPLEFTKDEVHTYFDHILSRIGDPRAKEAATPLHKKAVAALEEKVRKGLRQSLVKEE